MKIYLTFTLALLTLIVSACQPAAPVCPAGSITYQADLSAFPSADSINPSTSATVNIGGKPVQFDQVLHGPFCNAHLSGTVYIACDIQIQKWVDRPNFLDGCDLQVAPNTVIYAAAHKNAIYYNGCDACHTTQ